MVRLKIQLGRHSALSFFSTHENILLSTLTLLNIYVMLRCTIPLWRQTGVTKLDDANFAGTAKSQV